MGNWYPGDYKKSKTVKEVTHVSFDPRTRGRESNEFSNPPSHPTRKSGLIVPRFDFRPVLGLPQREWFPIPYYHANDNNTYCWTLHLSLYTLSDLSNSGNLIGQLSRTMTLYSPR